MMMLLLLFLSSLVLHNSESCPFTIYSLQLLRLCGSSHLLVVLVVVLSSFASSIRAFHRPRASILQTSLAAPRPHMINVASSSSFLGARTSSALAAFLCPSVGAGAFSSRRITCHRRFATLTMVSIRVGLIHVTHISTLI